MPLLRDGIGMMLYEWSDGKLGGTAVPIGARAARSVQRRVALAVLLRAACVTPCRARARAGPKGEGGLDDATGQSGGAGGGAGYTQTSATVDLGKEKRDHEGDSFGMKEALAQKLRELAKGVTGAR